MIKQWHKLLPGDLPQRVQFCEQPLDNNDQFLKDLIISDESSFALNVLVNTHNIREYCPQGEQPLNFECVK
jgi:hypothetical protein